jgi:transposase
MPLQNKTLFMAMELSKNNWKLAFGNGEKERQRTISAGSEESLLAEIAKAKEKLGLPADAQVVSCYEAGRDGFWIDRMLQRNGIRNTIMDPASIEVPRRSRTRKTDRLDASRLLRLLLRAELWGETQVFSRVLVPDDEHEALMRIGRERERLVKERTGHRTRIRSLGALHNIQIANPAKMDVDSLKDWSDVLLRPEVREELRREQQRLLLVEEQIKHLEKQQDESIAAEATPAALKAAKLCKLKSIGLQSGWLLGHECFGWRHFRNRKAVGSFAGLTGTPYDSGQTLREQGISKAGNSRVRTGMLELAWLWVRYQPHSDLTHWFVDNYVAAGTSRSKRKGIVALARKLLVALWKYVEFDVAPEGATLKA